MGIIKETADALIADYRDGGGFQRNYIVQRTLKGYPTKRLQKLTRYFYRRTVPLGHKDWMFYFKLVAWAIVERSEILEKKELEALIRHRKALLEKGPLPESALASSLGRGHHRKRRKRKGIEDSYMAKVKEKKAVKKEKASAKKAKSPSSGEKLDYREMKIGRSVRNFKRDQKFKYKKGADSSKVFNKAGKGKAACYVFKIGRTFNEAVEAFKTKEKVPEAEAKELVFHALRRLLRADLIEGFSKKEEKEEKSSKKEEKTKKKAKAKEEEEEEEEEEEDKKAKPKPKAKVKAKAKAEEEEEEEEEEEDEDEDEEEEDEDEDED